jgi:hypothetical protein
MPAVVCTGMKPFRPMRIVDFTAKFLLNNREVQSNKMRRFTNYLRATSDGTLFKRPAYTPQYKAYLTYHDPMPEVLQSSYADVEFEVNKMRSKHLDKRILFVGGDGLSIIRMNHLLKLKPDIYIDSAPLIIPMQGEAPHGVFHVMHAGWRLYQRVIRIFADLTLGQSANAVVDDPQVTDFNKSIYALWWMTRACSEYLLDLLETTSHMEMDRPDEIIQIAEQNIDLAWVVHFLHDFAFMVLDFKQAVRANKSKHIDVLWREFFATGHTGTSNKTLYVQMSIMRIWWADALAPPLAELYHALRAVPMTRSGVCVGWDTPIEWLNAAITAGVTHHVSDHRIEEFVRNFSFTDATYRALLADANLSYDKNESFMKDITSTVDKLKSHLRKHVGSTWDAATQPNRMSKLGIASRPAPPWEEVDSVMTRTGKDSVPAFVARHVRELTSTFYAFN